MFDKNNIYYFLRESGDLDFVFVKVFLLKFIIVTFFITIPLQSRRFNKREEKKNKEKRNKWKLSYYYGKLRSCDRSETDIRSESTSTTHFYVLSNCQLGYNRDISICQSIEFWLIWPLALITLSIYVATLR